MYGWIGSYSSILEPMRCLLTLDLENSRSYVAWKQSQGTSISCYQLYQLVSGFIPVGTSRYHFVLEVWFTNYKELRCSWCYGYCCRKWTLPSEFKSWTRPFVFHIALILWGKICIQLFSLQLCINSRSDWVNSIANSQNFEFKSVKLCLKIDLVSHPASAEGMVNTY